MQPKHLTLIGAAVTVACLGSLTSGAAATGPSGPTSVTGASGATGVTGVSGGSGASSVTGASGPVTRIVKVPPAVLRSGTDDVTITLSGSVAAGDPQPTLDPRVAGSWTTWGAHETFTPSDAFAVCGSYALTIPAGSAATGETGLRSSRTLHFTVACPSVSALQQALARLGYLPYRIESFSGVGLNVPLTLAMASERAYALPRGWLRREYRNAPSLEVGKMDPTTSGALEVWEQDHDVPVGTAPDAAIWRTLVREEALNHGNPRPYTWVTVTENTNPELLKVHENRRVVITSPANTGVPGATTQTGEFPIYVRYTSTTMIGTNVDGTHYDDPGIPWVNYFNGGDAVHGYPRASYGSPQSNGCVELPIATAERVYGQLMVGDLVDVSD
ncbi:MAG TPA: L,D-transpeptidase [Solirubrobacteraceae bacterium]|nr:L,D-transpeptidase [Solirubrobacteraceae bacterium]